MKYGLSEKQLEEIVDFIAQYPKVETAVLFGSRALGTYKEASDVDIALHGEKVNHSLAAKMKFNIEEDTYLNQIHTLEKLRDTLLPKLMSGEVRVAV